MKKNYYLLSAALCFTAASAFSYEVSTEPEKKHVLIEEFTGIHCGFCPQAHVITHNLKFFHPENIHVIALHQNSYAAPNRDEPDFRTTDGDLIGDGLNMTSEGRPAGVVNRRQYELNTGGTTYSTARNGWGTICRDMVEEDAPVNLYLKAECDGATRVLKITVEGYYTAAVSEETNYLHIAMTQDNIIGPQSGANMGDEYVHQHMLRDYLTDVWGDAVPAAEGEYFTKEYEFTLPEEIFGTDGTKSVPLVLQDINILAYVTADGKGEIYNVTEVKPEISNLETALAADLEKSVIEHKRYGFNYFEAVMTNRCLTALTSAEFEVTVNDVTSTYVWEGEIAALGKELIEVKAPDYVAEDSNSWSVTLKKLNGESVEEKTLSGTFTPPAEATKDVYVTLQVDHFWNVDNTWRILDADGNIVQEVTEGLSPAEPNKLFVELEENKVYCLEVTDCWANGIQSGMYKISKDDDSMIEQNYKIPDTGWRTFIRTSLSGVDTLAADSASALNYDSASMTAKADGNIEVYAASGCKMAEGQSELSLANLPAGIYIVRSGNDVIKVAK